MDEKASPAMPEALPLGQGVPVWKKADVTVWQGIFAPKGTPPSVIAEEAGVTPIGAGPEEFSRFIKSEHAKFAEVVARGNVKAE
ncbi:hypothetical protein QTH91_16920 [Variovorax dokdonensis]|uniref:Tripartite tricarboxylate transporter substrate binding protein n=1 Tax=Variovorax dokdonensis TaxID=344883 RepID=A0ABT7NE21_9BURK|nr:hypothetical protein [Variovorax dokdonensis]MDM0046176.1 hypothetical protein [Variovorax dokdonensis]